MAPALIALSLAFCLAVLATKFVKTWAFAHGIIDLPNEPRKVHAQGVPLLGGVAVFLSFSVITVAFSLFTPYLIGKAVGQIEVIAIILGGGIIMFGGYLDDRYHNTPQNQIIWPILAALVVMLAGIKVSVVSNPIAGGLIELGIGPSVILTFAWLMGMMYTTKLLDGLDGLASGIGAIGGLIVFSLTQFTPFYEPPVGLLAITLAGACLGFLIWNWHPAKIFLGEGGSLYIGFILGVLAIISGAKIATTLLVMGVPVLDVAWVILRRLFWEKRSLASSDRKHLHYRLLDAGLSQRQAVAVLYILTASFGVAALFLNSRGKLMAMSVLLAVMIILGAWVVWRYKQKQKTGPTI